MASLRPLSIGIDFGTANSAASAYFPDGSVRLLDLDPASSSQPELVRSLIYFPNRKEVYFGQAAIDQYFERDMEGRFLQSIKRLLPNPSFQGTSIYGKFMSVEELISRFLKELIHQIESQLGSIDGIPIFMGRPARYSLDDERESLAVERFKKACSMAGIQTYTLFDEPMAAALTYDSDPKKKEIVLVADLGGGTSDFTLMELGGGSSPRVLSVHGVPVAGDALDSAFMLSELIRYFGSEIRYQRPLSSNILTLPTTFVRLLPKWHHHAFLKEKSTWNFLTTLHKELVDPSDKVYLDNLITLIEDNLGYALYQRVEALKCELSAATEAKFKFSSYPIDIQFDCTLERFESIIAPSRDYIVKAAQRTLEMAGVEPDQIDAVYFTGGTSRVPLIRKAILEYTPHARVAEKTTFTSVAIGLSMAINTR